MNVVELASHFDGSPRDFGDALCVYAEPLLVGARDRQARFQLDVLDRFGPALDRFQLMLYVHAQLRDEFLKRHAEVRSGSRSGRPEATVALTDRSALVAEEVLALCRSGLGGGALTRWRTLYELCVITVFVLEGGDEVAWALGEHQALDALRVRRDYQHWARRTGAERLSDREMADYDRAERDLVARRGRVFLRSYGWAHEAMMRRSDRYKSRFDQDLQASPTLRNLASVVGADGDHLFFRRASAVIHGCDPRLVEDFEAAEVAPSLDGPELVLPLAARTFAVLVAALATCYPKPPDSDLTRVGEAVLGIADAVGAACEQ
jgi:hypothetical protein